MMEVTARELRVVTGRICREFGREGERMMEAGVCLCEEGRSGGGWKGETEKL